MKNVLHSTALITDDFDYFVDQFEDIRVLKYRLPGFESLTLQQKIYLFYLSQAALAGRDILWDQNFRFNILIRKTIEAVLNYYSGEKTSEDYKIFVIYAKRVFFSNGIHHHYSNDKLKPGFGKSYFSALIKGTDHTKLPLAEGQTSDHLISELTPVLFDDKLFERKIDRQAGSDLILNSSVNMYEDVTRKEVEEFYSGKKDPSDPHPISTGLNSKIKKKNGIVVEEVYRSGGLYGQVIDHIIAWLEKAMVVAETLPERKSLALLIDFYKSGDLRLWDDFNVAWVNSYKAEVDYNNGFIETYSDPIGMKATWEAVVNYIDREATKRSEIITANAQWFEDNSPIQAEYRKEKVTGVAAKVINIAMLGGDCYPASPLGINLPNSDWIRKEIGSKSITLGNITEAYDITAQGNGFLEEFAADRAEIDRIKKYGTLSEALHTDLHECVGHASGKLAPGTDPNSLKSYASALEEARADLFALYYIADKKLIDLGLIPDFDAVRSSYDTYIRNGLLTQNVRIQPGKNIEEAHMRNRAAICQWVFNKGKNNNVISLFRNNGKTYVKINDYEKLRLLFGDLLKEIQRIKSEGDYDAGKNLIESFGVKIDQELHNEILDRYKRLNLAPYTGFVNPELIPVYNSDGNITDIKVRYVDDYLGQMLEYGRNYSFL